MDTEIGAFGEVLTQQPIGVLVGAGEPTIADAILDRLVHNAHRIELRGESLRKPEDGSARAAAPEQPAERTKRTERRKRGETPAAETAPDAR